MRQPTEKKRVFIVVKTYPSPAKNGVEVSCTAGITDTNEWIRLFPITYRYLTSDKRFRKYQWIEVKVIKASDPRPESYKLDIDSIRIEPEPVSTTNYWQARKHLVFQLKSPSLCSLKRERDKNGSPTLGIFRPKIIEQLIIKPDDESWSDNQLEILRQKSLLESDPEVELQKIPYTFQYKFRCEDEACTGHTMICTDWEMGESWRKWKRDYGNDWESKFRQRYEKDMIEKNDTHFYVGTIHQHPHTWIIIGLFYPPHQKQPDLFG